MTKQLEQLLAMPINGNAHSDRPLFDAANAIILDDTEPMSDRIAALQRVDDAMGLDGVADEKGVLDYVADATLGAINDGLG